MKKLLSFILSLAMITSVLPMNALVAFADEVMVNTVSEESNDAIDETNSENINNNAVDEPEANVADDEKGEAVISNEEDSINNNVDNDKEISPENGKDDNDNEINNADNEETTTTIEENGETKEDVAEENIDNNIEEDTSATQENTENTEETDQPSDNNDIIDEQTAKENNTEDADLLENEPVTEEVVEEVALMEAAEPLPTIEIDLELELETEKFDFTCEPFKDEVGENILLADFVVANSEIVHAQINDYAIYIRGLKEGKTTVTAIGENGQKIVYNVTVNPKSEPHYDKICTVKVGQEISINDFHRLGIQNFEYVSDGGEVDVKYGLLDHGFDVVGQKAGVVYIKMYHDPIGRDTVIDYKIIVEPGNAKYFVLLPDKTIEDLGKEEAWEYIPNDSLKIGNWDKDSGIPGKLYSNINVNDDDGIRDYKNGFGKEYVQNPENMGEIHYKGDHFNLDAHKYVWYKIKDHGDHGYHVDGYILDKPVEVAYQWEGKTVFHKGSHIDGKVHTGDEITLYNRFNTQFVNGDKILTAWNVHYPDETKEIPIGGKVTVMNSMIIEPVWSEPQVEERKIDVVYEYGENTYTDEEAVSVAVEYNPKSFCEVFPNVKLNQNEEFKCWKLKEQDETIIDILEYDNAIILSQKVEGDIVLVPVIGEKEIPAKEIPVEYLIYSGGQLYKSLTAEDLSNYGLENTATATVGEQFNYNYDFAQMLNLLKQEKGLNNINFSRTEVGVVYKNSDYDRLIPSNTDGNIAVNVTELEDKESVRLELRFIFDEYSNVSFKAVTLDGETIDSFNAPTKQFYNRAKLSDAITYGEKYLNLEGYTFTGWELPEGMSETDLVGSKDFTLVAKYKQDAKVNFVAETLDGETIDNFDIPPVSYKSTAKISDIIAEAETKQGFNLEGHTFAEWQLPDGMTNNDVLNEEDITLVAKYSVNKYKVSFTALGIGTGQYEQYPLEWNEITNSPQEVTVPYGTKIDDIVKDIKSNRYSFGFKSPHSWSSEFQTVPAKDCEVTVIFKREGYDLVVNPEGVDEENLSIIDWNYSRAVYGIYKGGSVKLIPPTAEGYKFLGWFDEQGTKLSDTAFYFTVNDDSYLTAKFAKEATVEVYFYAYEDGSYQEQRYKVDGDFYKGENFPLTAENIELIANEHLQENDITNFKYVGKFEVLNGVTPVYYSKDVDNSVYKSLNEVKLSGGRNSIYVQYEEAKSINVKYYKVDGENQEFLGDYSLETVFNSDNVFVGDKENSEYSLVIENDFKQPKGYKLSKATLGDYLNGEQISNPFVMGDDNVEINVFYEKDNGQWKDLSVKHIYNNGKDTENVEVSSLENKVLEDSYEATPVLKNNDNEYILSSVTINGEKVELVDGKVTGTIKDNTNIVFNYEIDTNKDGIADKYQATFMFKSSDEEMGKVVGDLVQVVTSENNTFKVEGDVTTVAQSGHKFLNWTADILGTTTVFKDLDAIKASEFAGNVVFTANWEAVLSKSSSSHHRHTYGGTSTDNTDEEIPVEVIDIPDMPTPLADTPVVTAEEPYVASNDKSAINEPINTVIEPEEEVDFEIVEIEDETVPLASTPVSGWALVNLILTICTALTSILLIFKKKNMFKFLSVFPALASIVAFISTENMSNPMVMTDKWTLMMIVIGVIQAIVVGLSLKNEKDEDTETE